MQDLFDSALWKAADLRIPSTAFAERAGSFVNADDRLQSFDWAIRPPAGAVTEGHLLSKLLGHQGLYQADRILKQLATEISCFEEAAGEIPPHGVQLQVKQMA